MSKKIGYFHTKHQDLYIIIRVEYVNGKEFVVGVTVFRGSGFRVQRRRWAEATRLIGKETECFI